MIIAVVPGSGMSLFLMKADISESDVALSLSICALYIYKYRLVYSIQFSLSIGPSAAEHRIACAGKEYRQGEDRNDCEAVVHQDIAVVLVVVLVSVLVSESILVVADVSQCEGNRDHSCCGSWWVLGKNGERDDGVVLVLLRVYYCIKSTIAIASLLELF